MGYLWDTNIISLELKNVQSIKNRLDQLRSQKEQLYISGITYFEIKQGLLAVAATRKLILAETYLFRKEIQVLISNIICEHTIAIYVFS